MVDMIIRKQAFNVFLEQSSNHISDIHMNGSLTFILFLTAVIVVYSSLNTYFILKHRNFVTLKTLPLLLVRLLLVTIILTPVATFYFSWQGPTILATLTSLTGYSWLAFLFLFLMIHGSADIVLFISRRLGYPHSSKTTRGVFLLTMGLSLFILFYGWHEARQLKTERVQITTRKIPAGIKKITLLQISDVHFSPIIGEKMATDIYQIVQKEKPDIILSTGDLLDRGFRNGQQITSILRSLTAPLGKYAITGNHEFIADIKESTKFIDQAGFQLLRNKAVNITPFLTLAGVDDPAIRQFANGTIVPEEQVLPKPDAKRFTILLKHQPRIETSSIKSFDLQLSGHTHAGQIFPFTALVKLAFPYLSGMYEIDSETSLYVSRGSGTWGPPFRFLAPPEITLLELKSPP
ncbi:MAG: hypothetical protein HOK67_08725 [Deltaproteobacteria bacterium]|nr:hypothetical protein [Deltaproteobacteria bacterium]